MSERGVRVGLTGGFGTGKSTVAEIFRELGAEIIDADELARECLQPGRKECREVVEEFGEKILSPDGTIDRQVLAGVVFNDSAARDRLNRIVHPAVIREMNRRLASAPGPVTVAVIPLLFETGLEGGFDYVVAVSADPNTVRERTSSARGMTAEEIERRRASQLPLEEKARRSDFVIDNNGPLAETRRQVEEIWGILGNGG